MALKNGKDILVKDVEGGQNFCEWKSDVQVEFSESLTLTKASDASDASDASEFSETNDTKMVRMVFYLDKFIVVDDCVDEDSIYSLEQMNRKWQESKKVRT